MKLGSVGDKGLAGVRWCRLLGEEALGAAGLGMDGLCRDGLGFGVIKDPGLL